MIERLPQKLIANPKKVILQFLNLGEKRTKILLDKLLSIKEEKCTELLQDILKKYEHRHRNYIEEILFNYNRVEEFIDGESKISKDRRTLIGAYFSKEYSIEAAALFNPSIVPHPDQNNLSNNQLRFLLSLRATGEGHISSIEFREGIIDKDCNVELFEASEYSTAASYSTTNSLNDGAYNCSFNKNSQLSERVIYPYSDFESMGMEDVRFVKLNYESDYKYYGTYTAYNGKSFRTQLIETKDFKDFSIRPLLGEAIKDKGMALFPRMIDNEYYMLGRQDRVNIHLMKSKTIYQWDSSEIIKSPNTDWDFIQLGNCGSPIETAEGWLVITHAVGPMRRYVIGALLLDLNDPYKIVGELEFPLIEPLENEREGYVPNVVYSCGSLAHNNKLVIPYAMSDAECGFARVDLESLLTKIKIDKIR